MHIFLVNDDGIDKCGIVALTKAAYARGHKISICAPATPQSAASQRISLIDPIFVSSFDAGSPDITAYSIHGSPADCVRLGLFDLIKDPVDILISGINDGYNAGMAIHYSGTVSAAREGSLNHLHAIAASIAYHATPEMLSFFADYVVQVAEIYSKLPAPTATVLNINAPQLKPCEMEPPVFVPLSTANYLDSYLRRESPRAGTYYWLDHGARTEKPAAGTDQDMLEKGHITLTFIGNPMDTCPMTVDFTKACQALGTSI